MIPPTIFASVTVTVDPAFIFSVVVMVVTVAIALGETRWQVSHLREWREKVESETTALQGRITALEVREGRTSQRLDDMFDRLDRMESKLDKLLARKEVA